MYKSVISRCILFYFIVYLFIYLLYLHSFLPSLIYSHGRARGRGGSHKSKIFYSWWIPCEYCRFLIPCEYCRFLTVDSWLLTDQYAMFNMTGHCTYSFPTFPPLSVSPLTPSLVLTVDFPHVHSPADQHGQWRWQALLLPSLYMRSRHRKHSTGVQWLPRHHSADAPSAVRASVMALSAHPSKTRKHQKTPTKNTKKHLNYLLCSTNWGDHGYSTEGYYHIQPEELRDGHSKTNQEPASHYLFT